MKPVQESVVTMEQSGNCMLGILSHAENMSDTGIVIAIGGPQYRVGAHRQFVQMARHMAAAGIPTMRFDFVGMGDSDGRWDSFERVGPEIVTAIDAFMAAIPDIKRVILLGLCDAASAIMMNCNRDSRIAGLILLNPWARTEQGEAQAFVSHYYGRRLLQGSFWRKVFSGKFGLRRSLYDFTKTVRECRTDKSNQGGRGCASYIDLMMKEFRQFAGVVAIVLSQRDLTAIEFHHRLIQIQWWDEIHKENRHYMIRLPDADHTFSRSTDLVACSSALQEWIIRLQST